MGTRGAYGYRVNGKDYLTYNHFDSYPEGLGQELVEFVQKVNKTPAGWDIFKEFAQRVELVNEDTKPGRKLVETYTKYADTGVASRDVNDWYVLLRKLQMGKNLHEINEGNLAHMIDSHTFMGDSLFCEFAYIINLDTGKLECYRGFQKAPQPGNRYGTTTNEEYYPVALVGELAFSEVTIDKVQTLYKSNE